MTTQKSTILLDRVQSVWRGIGLTSLTLLASVSLLTGCSGMLNDAPTAASTGVTLQGNVHGGQQGVSGATVQLYAAQATGYGAASLAVLSAPVTTSSNPSPGNFTLPSYTCPASPNDQVYIVATGGDSGSGTNPNLALMAALGSCNAPGFTQTFVTVNEVTTVASAYALSGFMTDYAHVGTSSTNYVGLSNAMATVTNLVNLANGTALAVTPAYATQAPNTTSATFKSVVPQTEINTLANILASCVNTNGVGGSSGNCATLFASSATNTTTGGVSGTPDTIQAALNIALHPGTNVANLNNINLPAAPFSPSFGATPPNDWTISLNFIGGGMGGSGASSYSVSKNVAVDGSGNLWIVNQHQSTLTELNNLGAPISNNTQLPTFVAGGFSGGGLHTPIEIAVDVASPAHVWATNNNGVLSEFTLAGSGVGSGFTGGGLSGSANGIAIDGTNNIWATATSAIAEFNNFGTPLSGSGYTSDVSNPTGGISIDGGGGVLANEGIIFANGGNEFVDKFNESGSLVNSPGATLSLATAYSAIDASGKYWSPNNSNSLYVYANVPAGIVSTYSQFSLSSPTWVGVDGANHTWVVNDGGAGGQEIFANLTELSNTGSSISPASSGYIGTFITPLGAAIDQSGDVWVVNATNSSSVTEFVGVAAPTYAPLAAAVAANKIGQLP
jgi:hypothetical protein